MRILRVAKIADYALVVHQALLVLLALTALGTYVFFYSKLSKPTLLLKFRVRPFLSGLPRDLRKSAYSSYNSFWKQA